MKKALALYVILALPMLAQVPKPSGGGGSGGSGSGTVSGTSGKAAVFTSSTAVGDGTDGYCFNVVGGTLNVDSACFPLKHTSASAPVDGSDACATGDLWYRTGTVEFYICTDGDTDDWTKIPTISSTDTLTNKTLTTPIITSYTVATLPGTPTTGFLAVVTDAATAGSCTSGSGSAVSLCRYNGSAWAGIGDGGSAYDVLNEDAVELREEFVSGQSTTGAIAVGALGWFHQQSGTSTLTYRSTDSWPRIGSFRQATSATAGTNYSTISFTSVGAFPGLAGNSDKSWALKWIFSLVDTADVRYRIGLCGNANNIVPAEFIGVRFDTNASYDDDTTGSGNMYFESRTSSVSTPLTTSVAAGSTYRTLTIASDNYQNGGSNTNRIWLRIDAGTWVSVYSGSSDINAAPPSGNLTPCAIVGNDTTTAKSLDVDFFAFKATVAR